MSHPYPGAEYFTDEEYDAAQDELEAYEEQKKWDARVTTTSEASHVATAKENTTTTKTE